MSAVWRCGGATAETANGSSGSVFAVHGALRQLVMMLHCMRRESTADSIGRCNTLSVCHRVAIMFLNQRNSQRFKGRPNAYFRGHEQPDCSDGYARRGTMLCIVAVAICLSGGCQTTETVKRTFDYGKAFLPAEATQSGQEVRYAGGIQFGYGEAVSSNRSFVGEQSSEGYRKLTGSWLDAAGARIKPGARWPVVVFLHGCGGYGHYTISVAEYYLAAGAIVVAPNSMKRPGRAAMCGGGGMAYRATLRKQEARYAAEQLITLPWVDRERINLAGHSEGGNSVASYSGDEFAAHIITGVNCSHNGGAVSAPSDTPVLAIKGANDTYYPDGSCSVWRTFGGSRSIVIPNGGHQVVTSVEGKAAIYKFLRECCDIGTDTARRGE